MQMYSRLYLQSIGKQLDVIIALFIHDLQAAAATGETYYVCDSSIYEQYHLPKDVLVIALRSRFPGCEVTYHEAWNFPESRDRVLMKGIKIDWS